MNFKEVFITGKEGLKEEIKSNGEIRELDNKLHKLEQEKQQLLYEFGKSFYDNNRNIEGLNEFSKRFVMDVRQVEEEYEQLNQKRLYLQGKRVCTKCQAVMPADSLFCAKCGNKLEELSETITGCVCKKCGCKVEQDAMFCSNCGQKVGESDVL